MKKFLKNLLVTILIITTTVSVFIFTILDSTKKIVSKDNFTSIVKKIDIKELLGDEIRSKLYDTLEQTGMPTIYVDYVLESEELKEYISNYVYDSVENIVNGQESPTLNISSVIDKLISSFNNVLSDNNINTEKYLSKEDKDKIIEKIKVEASKIETLIVDNLTEEINDKLESKMSELKSGIETIKKIYSYQKIIVILIIVQLIFIAILNLKQFKFVKHIGIPFLINAILLWIINLIIDTLVTKYYPSELESFHSIINTLTDNVKNIWTNIEIRYLIVFIITIIINIVLSNFYKNKENNIEEDINIKKINLNKDRD